MLLVGDGTANVHGRQQGENHRLYDRDEDTHHQEWHRDQERDDAEESQHHRVIRADVAEEPHGQRDRPGDVAHELDGQHQGEQHRELAALDQGLGDRELGPEEMLEVLDSVRPDAEHMGGQEDQARQCQVGLQCIGGGDESGDQRQQVGEQDEEKQGADERQKSTGVLLAHHALHQVQDGVTEHLEEVAQAKAGRRNQTRIARAADGRGVARGPEGQEGQDQQGREHVVDTEVRGLEHLPGPSSAEPVLEDLLQGGVARKKLEPGVVRSHDDYYWLWSSEEVGSLDPVPPRNNPVVRIESTKTDSPMVKGRTGSPTRRIISHTRPKSSAIFPTSAATRGSGWGVPSPPVTFATARNPRRRMAQKLAMASEAPIPAPSIPRAPHSTPPSAVAATPRTMLVRWIISS